MNGQSFLKRQSPPFLFILVADFMKDRNLIILLVVLQLILCLSVITLFPISLDEPFSIYHAQFPLDEMISEISKGNNSPLHFVLLHFWIKIGGIGVFWVRLLSVLFSLVSVVYLFKLARKFWRKEFAVLLVGLFILSRLNHYVAMEARMYGLFTLFFILILYDAYQLLFENKKVFWRLGLWNALLLYTHYLGGVVMVMEGLMLLAFYSQWNRNNLIQAVLSLGVTGLLFFPGMNVFLDRANDFQQAGSWVKPAEGLDLWTNLVKLMNNQFTLFTVMTLLLILVIWRWRKSAAEKILPFRYFGIAFMCLYGLMFVISLTVQPVFNIKYLQFLTVPLFFVLVAVVAMFPLDGKKKWISMLLIVPFIFSFKPVPSIDRNTDELVDYVREKRNGETTVFYCPPHYDLTLAYHYSPTYFSDYYNTHERMLAADFYPVYSSADFENSNGAQRIIYIDFDAKMLYPDNGILEYLDSTFVYTESKAFEGDFTVYVYEWYKEFNLPEF